MRIHTVIPSPLGDLVLVFDEPVLVGVYQPGQKITVDKGVRVDNNYSYRVEDVVAKVKAYLLGQSQEIAVPIDYEVGTELQQKVWDVIVKIPYGETLTYSELTKRMGLPAGNVRSVSSAVGKNPLTLVIPCHRVVAANGKVSYSGGVENKKKLLELESSSRSSR